MKRYSIFFKFWMKNFWWFKINLNLVRCPCLIIWFWFLRPLIVFWFSLFENPIPPNKIQKCLPLSDPQRNEAKLVTLVGDEIINERLHRIESARATCLRVVSVPIGFWYFFSVLCEIRNILGMTLRIFWTIEMPIYDSLNSAVTVCESVEGFKTSQARAILLSVRRMTDWWM